MEYKIKKMENGDGTFQFLSMDNKLVFNINFEDAQSTIEEHNHMISNMKKYIELMNYMVENNISEYNPYIHGFWHDTGSTIKVVLTHEQNTTLIKYHPELLTYVLNIDNNVSHYIEEKHIYIYVNYFQEGHKELLEDYGAIFIYNNENTTEEPNE